MNCNTLGVYSRINTVIIDAVKIKMATVEEFERRHVHRICGGFIKEEYFSKKKKNVLLEMSTSCYPVECLEISLLYKTYI